MQDNRLIGSDDIRLLNAHSHVPVTGFNEKITDPLYLFRSPLGLFL